MYKSYLECHLGTLEIGCDDQYLNYISIVKKMGSENENDISKEVKKQLKEYFNCERFDFDLPINFSNTFKDRVYQSLYNTNYGDTLTYKDLAVSLDSKAYQAVGSAMATNPYFIVVP